MWAQPALGSRARAGRVQWQLQAQKQQQEMMPLPLQLQRGVGWQQRWRRQWQQHLAAARRTWKQRQLRRQQWWQQRRRLGALLGLLQCRRGHSRPGCQSSCWICLIPLLGRLLSLRPLLYLQAQQQVLQHGARQVAQALPAQQQQPRPHQVAQALPAQQQQQQQRQGVCAARLEV